MMLDAVADAAQYYGSRHAHDDAQERAEAAYVMDFIKACQKLDANAIANFAPEVADFDMVTYPRPVNARIPKRLQTLAEVVVDGLESGPGITPAVQLILNLAFGTDCQANLARRARELLAEAANASASEHVTVGEV